MNKRTTVTIDEDILFAAKMKAKLNKESLTAFLNRAIVNQLEKEGDSDIRYLLELRNENE